MKTKQLFTLLKNNSDKSLLFEYAPTKFVAANYHITEVKHIVIDAVDCGAQTDTWKETIIQLWESPNELGKTEFMTVKKALSILERVGKMKPYNLNAEVKFEYSNATFHTAQLFIDDFEVNNNNLIVKLAIKKTDCKAKSFSASEENKQTTKTTCCTPKTGCC